MSQQNSTERVLVSEAETSTLKQHIPKHPNTTHENLSIHDATPITYESTRSRTHDPTTSMVSSSQCHCARRRPGTPQSQVGIWITDLMLQQAIGRFQRRSLVTNRSLGSHKVLSVSGRRPVSRRQLTEAMPSSQYQPLWWFELVGNPHAWQWQPPSTVHERREKEKHLTWSRSVDKIIAWLEASDLDKPFLDPPTDAIDHETIETTESSDIIGTIQASEATEALAEETQAVAAQVAPETLASHVENLRSAIASFSKADSKALSAAVRSCCKALEVRILCAQFAPSEVAAVLATLETATLDSPLPRNILDGINQRIMRTILRAVCSLCPPETPDAGGANAMGELAVLYRESMAAILGNIHGQLAALQGHMFSQLMDNLQIQDTFVTHIVMRIVQATVKEHAMGCMKLNPHLRIEVGWISELNQLSDKLCQLPKHMSQKIAAHMQDVYFDNPNLRRFYRPDAFMWLFIATRAGLHTQLEELLLIKEFKRQYSGYLKTTEVVALGMQRLVRERVLDEAQHMSLVARLGEHTYPPFFMVVMLDSYDRNSSNRGALKDFMAWAIDVGEGHRMTYAMIVAQLSHEHPHLANRARQMMRVHLAQPNARRARFLTEIQRVGHIVRSYAHLRGEDLNPDDQVSPYLDWKRFPQIIDQIAIFLAENVEMSDRQLQRGIEWCLTQAELVCGRDQGSEVVLQAFADVLVRKLSRGIPMVPAKKKYLLAKIEQYQGMEKADRVELKLSEWQRFIDASNRAKAARLLHSPRPGKKP